MASWKILSNYKTFGLAYAVELVAKQCKKSIGVKASIARKMALRIVRLALTKAINDKSFYQA